MFILTTFLTHTQLTMCLQHRNTGIDHRKHQHHMGRIIRTITGGDRVQVTISLNLRTLLLTFTIMLVNVTITVTQRNERGRIERMLLATINRTRMNTYRLREHRRSITLTSNGINRVTNVPLTILNENINGMQLFPLNVKGATHTLAQRVSATNLT